MASLSGTGAVVGDGGPDAAFSYPGWRRNLVFVWIGVFVGLLGANFVFPFIPFFIKDLGVTDNARVSYYAGLTASATGGRGLSSRAFRTRENSPSAASRKRGRSSARSPPLVSQTRVTRSRSRSSPSKDQPDSKCAPWAMA